MLKKILYLSSFVSLILFSQSLVAQTLSNAVTSLSTDGSHTGRILDVKYVPEHKIYLVVGDFSNFNNNASTRQNFVVLDENLSPISSLGLDSCNGPINTVEYLVNSNPDSITVWLGGRFNKLRLRGTSSSVNRNLFAEIYIKKNGASFTHGIQTTNPILDGEWVNDIEYIVNTSGTTKRLVVGGQFYDINTSNASSTPIALNGKQLFAINYTSLLRPRVTVTNNIFSSEVYSIEEIPNSNGTFCFSNTNNQLTYVSNITTWGLLNSINHKSPSGATVFKNYASPRLTIADNRIVRNDQFHMQGFEGTNPNAPRRTSLAISASAPYISDFQISAEDHYPGNYQYYNGCSYSTSVFFNDFSAPNRYYPTLLGISKYNEAGTRNIFSFLGTGGDYDIDFDSTLVYKQDELFIAGNYLFTSYPNITGTSSNYIVTGSGGGEVGKIAVGTIPSPSTISLQTPITPRSKVVVYCLEPKNPGAFVSPDSVICSGNEKIYTIPTADFAEGYKWTYTGDASKLKVKTSAGGVYGTFTGVIRSSTPNLYVEVQDGFNGGTLTVRPYLHCNTNGDTLFSKPVSQQLYPAAIPDIQITGDSLITCLVSTITLQVSSSMATTNTWYENNIPTNSSSLELTGEDALGTYYLASVIETAGNQCKATDSIYVSEKIYYPDVEPHPNADTLVHICSTDSLLVQLIDISTQFPQEDAIFFRKLAGDTIYFDSMYVSTFDDFKVYAYYPSLGCIDSSYTVMFMDSTTPPDVSVLGANPMAFSYDTLNCFNPSLSLELISSDGPSIELFWSYLGDSIPDNLTINIGDSYLQSSDTVANDPVFEVVYIYGAYNPSNQCYASEQIAVSVDYRKPLVLPYDGPISFNCSHDSIQIGHPFTSGVNLQGWNLPDLSYPDSIYVSDNDEAIFAVQGLNGCWNYDTTTIQQTIYLELISDPDSVVCPGTPFTVSTQAIGNDNYTYTWNTGSTTNSASGVGGEQSEFSVVVNSSGGCIGKDTIHVTITDPITATFIGYVDCSNSGYIQVEEISGGAVINNTQYQYNFNNEGYTSSPVYTVEEFIEYPVSIMDTLLCEYQFNTTEIPVAEIPAPEFLVATHNEIEDIVAMVNIATFQGFDTIIWGGDPSVHFIDVNDSVALFYVLDTGWVELTYTGLIIDEETGDTCFYTFSKVINFSPKSFDINEIDNLGVQDSHFYPNPVPQGADATLEFTLGAEQDYFVFVTDQAGKILPGLSWEGSGNGPISIAIPTAGLAAASYHLHILCEYGGITINFAVQ